MFQNYCQRLAILFGCDASDSRKEEAMPLNVQVPTHYAAAIVGSDKAIKTMNGSDRVKILIGKIVKFKGEQKILFSEYLNDHYEKIGYCYPSFCSDIDAGFGDSDSINQFVKALKDLPDAKLTALERKANELAGISSTFLPRP